MHFGNITDRKLISQAISDCGLHNVEYTIFQLRKNFVFRASTANSHLLWLCLFLSLDQPLLCLSHLPYQPTPAHPAIILDLLCPFGYL
jgi:hypothetical protein